MHPERSTCMQSSVHATMPSGMKPSSSQLNSLGKLMLPSQASPPSSIMLPHVPMLHIELSAASTSIVQSMPKIVQPTQNSHDVLVMSAQSTSVTPQPQSQLPSP